MKAGKYIGKVVDVKIYETKTGKEAIMIVFQVEGGECGGELVDWRGYFTDAAVDRCIEQMRVAGFKGNDIFETSSMIGTTCGLVVEIDDYIGYDRPVVRWINPPTSPSQIDMIATIDPSMAASFRAKMAEKLSKKKSSEKKNSLYPKTDADVVCRRDSEDIPF
jgi:hypothetical protein